MRNFDFDFTKPDYAAVARHRLAMLKKIRQNPEKLPALREFYRNNIAQFIIDWGVTVDPRNVKKGLPAVMPFVLFDKQIEWVNWFVDCWKNDQFCIVEKSRDMGVSWLSVAVSCAICLLYDDITVGFGSNKEASVDRRGDPKSIFYKIREFIKHIPSEFRGGWEESRHAAKLRTTIPATNSKIVGECGINIARGGRYSFFFLDEAAHVEHAEAIDASLSQATPCRCDISTPRGMANPFAQKRHSGLLPVFTFHWRDYPGKDDAWYEATKKKINNPIIVAQELDLDYTASVPGIVIPAIWVNAAIDAHIKLKIEISGIHKVGFDIADQGQDQNSLVSRHGSLLVRSKYWSGKGDDIYGSTLKTFEWCDQHNYSEVDYDSVGLGASVRGDAKVINEKRTKKINFTGFNGAGAVVNPRQDAFARKNRETGIGRTNQDYYENRKAQAWFCLRRRFELTYLAVNKMIDDSEYSSDELISIDGKVENLHQLKVELSQPTFLTKRSNGKVMIDKKPDGARSPNLADSAVIAFAPIEEQTTKMHRLNYMQR